MTVNTMRKPLLVLALLVISGVACRSADSVLRVNLDPSTVSSVTLLASQVTIGSESRTIDIASPYGQPIALSDGTSCTIEVPSIPVLGCCCERRGSFLAGEPIAEA